MFRLFFILCFLLLSQSDLFCQRQIFFSDLVEEYRQTKNGITLITNISLRDSIERGIFDAFLSHLNKKLKRPNKDFKILLLIDYKTRSWNAAIGFDTLRFGYKAMVDYYYPPQKEGTVEIVLKEPNDEKDVPDTEYAPKKAAPDWSASYDRTEKELGLKLLYKSPISDTTIFFDRIYSMIQYGIDHFEKIKREQRRMEMEYDGYALSVLTIDTTETKKIHLKPSGFDPRNIQVEEKRKWPVWIIVSIILLGLLLFFIFRKRTTDSKQ